MTRAALTHCFLGLCLALIMALPGTAQGLFDPAARVNDSIITEFEIQQRVRLFQVLNAPGASRKSILDALIDDRLRVAEARRLGLTLTDEELIEAQTEFAARGDLGLEEFQQALGRAGVEPETLRDFVSVNAIWREYIRARYGSRVQISEREIDRALAATTNPTGLRVLLSEIIIPAPAQGLAQAQARAERASQAASFAEFESFARQFSASGSRNAGGRLPWTPVNQLPPGLRSVILGLAPGEVTDPLPIPNAIALFQLRALEETSTPTPSYAAIEYAAYYIDGGRTEQTLAAAKRLKTQVDVCDDLYGVAQGQPEEVLERGSLPPSEIPEDIAIELAKLDPGEVSTNLTRADGRTLVFLMLCGRTGVVEEDVDRGQIANQLRGQRLQGFSDSLLEELRSEARIVRF